MKNNIWNSCLVFGIVFSSVLLSSCKQKLFTTNRGGGETLPYNIIVDSLINNYINYSWLKIKGNATLLFKDNEKQIKTNFRLKKDSVVWANFSKSGVQILTSLISKDSVKFLKKINDKEYFLGSFDDVEDIIDLKLNYMLVQDFLCGNALMLDKDEKYISSFDKDTYLISTLKSQKINKIISFGKNKDRQFLYRCWVDPITFKCKRVEVNVLDKKNTIVAEYNNWKDLNGYLFPLNSSLSYFSDHDTVKITIQYSPNIKMNIKQTLPFRVNKSYSPFKTSHE